MIHKNKNHTHKDSSRIIIIVALILVVAGILGFVYWKNFTSPDALTLNGTVKSISRDCHTESLNPVKKKTDVEQRLEDGLPCHGGDTIRINDKLIYTSSEGADPSHFGVDTSSIRPGDVVSVVYVPSRVYGLSLNCNECSITVTKPANQQD